MGTAVIGIIGWYRYLVDPAFEFLQVLKLPMALKLIFSAKNDGDGDVNSFKALCTALAATVGTGNIVGVATAIKAGGPGACSGCGWRHFLVWLPNMPKVFWR